ncbi:MAG: Hsp20/alpha crystallin family protein [Myxococcaceae bacterium]
MATTGPAVDVYEDREEIVLRAEVPGMEQKDIEVLLEDSTLTLRGERKLVREDKKENYRRIETEVGVFARTFSMPSTIDPDKIRADLHNGVLEIHVAKKEGARAKSIPVNA